MPARSLFYHVHAARRRTGGTTDDFSAWLRATQQPDPEQAEAISRRIQAVDFYFLNFNQLREALVAAFEQRPDAASPVALSAAATP
jgi:hypothetical protein